MKQGPTKNRLLFFGRTGVPVSARGLRLARRTMQGAQPLAATIAARYASSRLLGPSLDLVLRRLPLLRVWKPVHQHTTVAITPRLFIRFSGGTSWPNETLIQHIVTMLPGPAVCRKVLQREAHQMFFERIFSREVRREVGEHPLARPLPSRTTMRTAQTEDRLDAQLLDRPISRVFRKYTSAARAEPSSPPAYPPTLTRAAAPPFRASTRNAETVHALETIPSTLLNRITDHVIETIDHRMVAGRERCGKA